MGSGLGILLVLPVGATAVLGDHRDALPHRRPMAALAVLIQQIFAYLGGDSLIADYTTAGVLGAVLFGGGAVRVAHRGPACEKARRSSASRKWTSRTWPSSRSTSCSTCARASSSWIARTASVSSMSRRPRCWATAAPTPGARSGEAAPRLLYLLETWRQTTGGPMDPGQSFVAADGGRLVRPALRTARRRGARRRSLIFLEDMSLIEEKAQQAKLAALGRLSASIAHEIRNPVGAMSHAGQLLAESDQLSPQDKRLTEIIRANADRVSTIINNVLQLSRREATPPRAPLAAGMAG